MDIRTSTPIVMPKNFGQISRASDISSQYNLNPQLFNRNNNHQNKLKGKAGHGSRYSQLDGPCFVDFENGIPEPRDSFFDGRPSFCPTPAEHKQERDSLLTSENDIMDSLKRWSISKIHDTSDADTTLKASECTIREFQHSKNSMQSIGSDLQRRDSRQSFTTVKPFSFESREKERQERKEAKLNYINILQEQRKPELFKAKPAPKFNNTKKPIKSVVAQAKSKIQVPEKKNEIKKIIGGQKPQVLPENNNCFPKIVIKKEKPEISAKMNEIIQIFEKQPPGSAINHVHKGVIVKKKPEPVVKTTSTVPMAEIDTKTVKKEKVQLSQHNNRSNATNSQKRNNEDTHSKPQSSQPWKQKPFQISLPKRKLCIARSPNLLTAQRARKRQLFENKMKEKEKQLEESRKKNAALNEQREKEEVQKLRKQLVHKAKPAPLTDPNSIISKRTLSNPLMPIFVKRRKIDRTK